MYSTVWVFSKQKHRLETENSQGSEIRVPAVDMRRLWRERERERERRRLCWISRRGLHDSPPSLLGTSGPGALLYLDTRRRIEIEFRKQRLHHHVYLALSLSLSLSPSSVPCKVISKQFPISSGPLPRSHKERESHNVPRRHDRSDHAVDRDIHRPCQPPLGPRHALVSTGLHSNCGNAGSLD